MSIKTLNNSFRIGFCGLVICVILYARNDPFRSGIQDISNNKTVSGLYLQEEAIGLPGDARKLDAITITYISSSGEKKQITTKFDYILNSRIPLVVYQDNANVIRSRAMPSVEYIPFSFIKYVINYRLIRIYTTHKKIRHFHLPKPFKLVFDFESNVRFRSLTKPINRFEAVGISTVAYKGFFRATFTLDGPYKYTVKPTSFGYEIQLH